MSCDAEYMTILADLPAASLAALMDVAEGYWIAVFEYPWILDALKRRDLVRLNLVDFAIGDILWNQPDPVELTDLGMAFVHWYRSRDLNLPVQEQLL